MLRTILARVLAALAVTHTLLGCTVAPMTFLHQRLNDLRDIIPFSWSYGSGAFIGVRATRFFAAGVGSAYVTRVGWSAARRMEEDEHREYGKYFDTWHAFSVGMLIASMRTDNPRPPSGIGGNFLVFPIQMLLNGEDPSWFVPWRSMFDFEFELHAGVGIRVGFSPIEMIDSFAGWLGLDPCEDDSEPKFIQRGAATDPPEDQGHHKPRNGAV